MRFFRGMVHTHIFQVDGIRLIVSNTKPLMDWNDWFNRHPEAGLKLSHLLLSLAKKQ